MQFLNPVYFIATVALIILGAFRKWLTTEEVLLAVGLLLIPYVTHSYRAVMMGHARYAASVFPAYIVMGKLLNRCPEPLAGVILAFSGFFLGVYSALFAAWYQFI